jgi:type I restriction enzyme S subunit
MNNEETQYFKSLTLGHFLSELPKSTLPASIARENGSYPFYSSSSVVKYCNTFIQEKPTVLMGTGGIASVNFGNDKFAYSTDTWAFRSNNEEELKTEYIYRAIQFKLPKIDYCAFEGSGLKHLRKDFVKKLNLRVPANKLVSVKILYILRTIDQAIEKTEALMEKYKKIKAGLMHDLFIRGIGADGKLRPNREQAPELYQQTPIGWIPKDWQYVLLDNLAKRGSGHTPNKNIPSYWNGGVKWVSLSDSRNLDNLHISDTDLEISHLGIENSSAVLHPAGTVIMTRDAGVGKSAIITESMAVSQHFMAWRCGDKIDNYFLYYWLQLNKRTFENVAMGSTIVTIGLPYFKKLKLAVPVSFDEQNEIGRRLKTIDSYIQSHKADSEKLKQQKSGLMHDLLTGKVQVPINSTEADNV